MSDPQIFHTIEQLIAAQPLDPAKVGRILGTKVVRHAAGDTGAVQTYVQADGATAYQGVDLRMPDPDMGRKEVVLSVTTTSDEGVDEALICARFGTEFQSEIPSPRYTPGTVPVYLVYDKPWGKLKFGVTADRQRKLVRFVLTMATA